MKTKEEIIYEVFNTTDLYLQNKIYGLEPIEIIVGIKQAMDLYAKEQPQLTEAEIEQEATEYANSKQKNKNIIWVNLRAGYKAALLARAPLPEATTWIQGHPNEERLVIAFGLINKGTPHEKWWKFPAVWRQDGNYWMNTNGDKLDATITHYIDFISLPNPK